MKRERPYRISDGLIKKLVGRPGLLMPVFPLTANTGETTDYVHLKIEGPYLDEHQNAKKILLSTFKMCGLAAPKANAYHRFAQVLFRAAPQEIAHPYEAAEILQSLHGDPELISMLKADRMDLLYLNPDNPNDEKADPLGSTYHRDYVYCTSINALYRASQIPTQGTSAHCTLPLRQAEGAPAYGVGRLWLDGETSHLLSWRHPAAMYGLNRPPPQDDAKWIYPGLSTFGRDGRGIIILFDVGLFDLIYYRYLQACAYLMPMYDAVCPKP